MKRLGEILGDMGEGIVEAGRAIGRQTFTEFERGIISAPWTNPVERQPFKLSGFDLGKVHVVSTTPRPLSEDEEAELIKAAAKRFAGCFGKVVWAETWTTEEELVTQGDWNAGAGLSIDAIREAIERMELHKPFARGLWFVDCLGVYYQFCNQVEEVDHISPMTPGPQDGRFLAAMSLPIINFQKEAMGEGEIIAERGESAAERAKALDWQFTVWPWFCNHPGIWVEMSDGSHRHYVVVDGRMVQQVIFE